MARASYLVSARAMALVALKLAWYCAAACPDLSPPLTTVLAKVGFVDHLLVDAVISEWLATFEMYRPSLVVGDFAPFARIACLGVHPFCAVGSGYTIPPEGNSSIAGHSPFKPDNPGLVQFIMSQLGKSLSKRNLEPLLHFEDLLRGDTTFVATLPMFDPFRNRALEERIGPFVDYPNIQKNTPTDKHIYAYLHSLSRIDIQIINKMKLAGFTISVFVDDGDKDTIPGAAFLAKPLSIQDIAMNYSAVYHQGGLGLSTACAIYGLQQVVAPKHDEAAATASQLSKNGLGFSVDIVSLTNTAVAEEIISWLQDESLKGHVQLLANSIGDWVKSQKWKDQIASVIENTHTKN